MDGLDNHSFSSEELIKLMSGGMQYPKNNYGHMQPQAHQLDALNVKMEPHNPYGNPMSNPNMYQQHYNMPPQHQYYPPHSPVPTNAHMSYPTHPHQAHPHSPHQPPHNPHGHTGVINAPPHSPVPSQHSYGAGAGHSSMQMPTHHHQPPASPHPLHSSGNHAMMDQPQHTGMQGTVSYQELISMPVSAMLEKVFNLQRNQKDTLLKIRQAQKQVMCNPQEHTYNLLSQQHTTLKDQIDMEMKALQTFYTQTVLHPAEVHRLLILVQELKIQQTQLELFRQELHQLVQSHAPSRCIATLVISQEPFPMVVTKGKQLDEDAVVVQLLSGANVEFQSFSPMKVVMLWDNHQSKSTSQKTIEEDTQAIDAYNRVAKWHLKFLNGTRKNSVTLRFVMQVQVAQPNGGPVTVTVESHPTRPFIVITNECQWEESEGALLKKEAFGEQNEIYWPQFANVLQRHFLRATRQDAVNPSRSLCKTDLEYIHSRFFDSQTVITPKAYTEFWNWFGKTVKKLRYQRHILSLWQLGQIHGFLHRDAVHSILRGQDGGTFLVRFSERHAGQFAVAYRIDEQEDIVRHYLIQPDDTAGNKKTLPDFLAEQPAFTMLLQIATENEHGGKVFQKVSKDKALQPYISKRPAPPPAAGYDRDIPYNTSTLVEMESDLLDAE